MSRSKKKGLASPSSRWKLDVQLVAARALERQAPVDGPQRVGKRTASSRRLSQTSLRQALHRVPMAAWLCAGVACVNAVCWSIITPPFEVPDEPEHVAYVKQLAETGRLPQDSGTFSFEETVALTLVHLQAVAEEPEHQTISSRAQQEELEHDLTVSKGPPQEGREYAGVAVSEPPLYYALQAIPYSLGAGGTLLDRIELMRLLSALMGGLTALFVYLFIREVLPRSPWAWTVGGLGVALAPMLGFMSGAVNPDAMLYAVTAAAFYGLARAFRRGMTRRHAAMLGVVTAIGLMTKLNFIGIAPGVLLGMIVLSVCEARTEGRRAYISLALALALAISPVVVYVMVNLVSGTPTLGIVSHAVVGIHGSLWRQLSYIWQLYLPRLPGMRSDFSGFLTTRQIWFNGYVGLFGWLDTPFPGWVYDIALIPAGVILGLFARSLIASVGELRKRVGELVVYCVMGVGLMTLVGTDSAIVFPGTNAEYGQVRYLLPLLPLFGVALALAARGAGRRWGPTVGAVMVVLFLAHDIFSQLQVVARFYG